VTNVVSLVDTGISVWQAALERLRIDCKDYLGLEMLDIVTYDGIADGVVQLSVPDEFRENWIKSHYADMMRKAFSSVLGSSFVDFSIRIAPQVTAKTVFPRVAPVAPRAAVAERPKKRAPRVKLSLYAGYTFENFIEGDSNFTACEACKAVAEKPGDPALNPLFVYGKSGLGKTHLLQSIAAYMLKARPQTKVVYCHAYDFLSDATAVSKALKAKTGNVRELANAFMEKYERCDVLLFDDVQLLESKKTISQERLAVLVKHLRSMGKQVVFSSDRHPSEFRKVQANSEIQADGGAIPHISARLLAPLESCVAVGIDVPDLNTRMKLIQKKSMNIPFLDKDRDEICRFLSLPPRENVRVIEGMLNGLRAMNEFCSENLDLGAVKRLVAAPGTTGVVEHTIKGIAETVAMEFGSDLTSLASKRQDAGVALPRKVSMFLSREMTNSSLADIGSFFNRDYSSVIAAIQSLTKQMDKDENLARRVKDIRYLLEA
jgi:chromosomal replication initiator protein